MRYYNNYWSTEEIEELKKKEEKIASKLNEIGFAKCTQCQKKLVRIFSAKPGRIPVFKNDVSDYLRRMRNAISAYEKRGAKSECHISGPEYTVVFNSAHFVKPYSDNIGKGATHGYCNIGAYLGYSAVDVVSRLFLRHRMIRRACISNGVKPQEIRDWMGTLSIKTLGDLFGYGFALQEIKNTDLWAGVYKHSEWHANTASYDVVKVAGPEWAAEMDPIICSPGDAQKYNYGQHTMSPTHGGVEYSTTNYKADLAVDLPNEVEYDMLAKAAWDRVLNIRTLTGIDVKVKVSANYKSAKSINTMTYQLDKYKVPQKFWIIQPETYRGSFEIQPGDIVL